MKNDSGLSFIEEEKIPTLDELESITRKKVLQILYREGS